MRAYSICCRAQKCWNFIDNISVTSCSVCLNHHKQCVFRHLAVTFVRVSRWSVVEFCWQERKFLSVSNYLFTVIFFVEMAIKVSLSLCLHWTVYCFNNKIALLAFPPLSSCLFPLIQLGGLRSAVNPQWVHTEPGRQKHLGAFWR